MTFKITAFAALAAAAAIATPAAAQEYVTNGNFNTVSNNNQNFEVDKTNSYGTVSGWTTGNSSTSTNPYNILFHSGIATNPATGNAVGQYTGTGREFLWALPSNNGDHGNFMALDGDTSVNGTFSTILAGLSVGSLYTLNFDWATGQIASRSGDTMEGLRVQVGNLILNLDPRSTPSQGSTPWTNVSANFTATSASQTLSFLAIGSPNGLPPVALLDNVSVKAAVPEPATWALMLLGFGAMGVSMRKRRQSALAVA